MLKRKPINRIATAALLLLLLLNFFSPIPVWAFGIVAFIWFLITLCGSFLIRMDYHYPSLHSNKQITSPYVSITFDDGPHPEFTPKILELLELYNAKATFFCIGKLIEQHPELFKQIVQSGHTVGNHTYSHSKSFGFFGTNKVIQELNQTSEIVDGLVGLKMNFYRPAFGVTNPNIEKAVKIVNLNSIGWNVRSLDTTPRSAELVLHRITSKISKGDIVLLHDTSEKTVLVLERLLLFLKDKNLQSVPVDQLLQQKPYA